MRKFSKGHKSKSKYVVPRDNVILEYGMFLSRLGIEKTFFVVPESRNPAEKIHIATDLLGVQYASYDPEAIKNTSYDDALTNVYVKLRKVIK